MSCKKNYRLLSVFLLMTLFLGSCSTHDYKDNSFSDEADLGNYLIITTSMSAFNPKVFIRSFDE